ncbi:MAG: hypothetical protein AAF806_29140, partial [Bacteroidota bacterium]
KENFCAVKIFLFGIDKMVKNVSLFIEYFIKYQKAWYKAIEVSIFRIKKSKILYTTYIKSV